MLQWKHIKLAPRQHHVEQIFRLFFLLQIVSRSRLDESLEIVGILFHTRQQVVEEVAAAVSVSAKTNIKQIVL